MNDRSERQPNRWRSRATVAFGVFAVIAALLLFAEHRMHLVPWLPWALLAACPLMHIFMHGSHGRHRDHAGERSPGSDADRTAAPVSRARSTIDAGNGQAQVHRDGGRS